MGAHAHPRPERTEGGSGRCRRGTRRQRRTRRPPTTPRRERPRRATSRVRNEPGEPSIEAQRPLLIRRRPERRRGACQREVRNERPCTGRAGAVETGQPGGVVFGASAEPSIFLLTAQCSSVWTDPFLPNLPDPCSCLLVLEGRISIALP